MDTRQRSALRMHYKDLVDQLILDEDFYAALQREKLFTDSMILDIKSQGRDRDRVYKMLELLKKRGPKAFDSFVAILKENFSWLADMLEKTYESKSFVYEQVSEREETTQKTMTSRLHSTGSSPKPEQTNNTHIKYSNSLSTSESQTVLLVEYHENKHQDAFITRSMFKEFKSIGVSPIRTIAIPRKMEEGQRSPLKAIRGNEETNEVTHIVMPKTSDVNCQNVTSGSHQILPKSEYLSSDVETNTTGINHAGNENEVDEDTISTSDMFYGSIRRASSTVIDEEMFEDWGSDYKSMLEEGAYNEQDARDIINVYRRIFETELEKARIEITKYDQAMNDVSLKLRQKTNEDAHTENDQDYKVSWEKIHTEIDKLPKLVSYLDKAKMIKECYQLFDETDQRKPLNFHILNLLDQKNTLENRIKDLIKELDGMANDMYRHQQDMRIIQNLKQSKYILQQEKACLLEKIRYLEDNFKKRDSLIVEREKQIQDLECRIKVLEQKQKKPNIPHRRALSRQIQFGVDCSMSQQTSNCKPGQCAKKTTKK